MADRDKNKYLKMNEDAWNKASSKALVDDSPMDFFSSFLRQQPKDQQNPYEALRGVEEKQAMLKENMRPQAEPDRALAGEASNIGMEKSSLPKEIQSLMMGGMKPVSQEPMKDDELEAAQKNAALIQLMTALGKSGNQIGASIARTKADNSVLDTVERGANQGVADILTKRKAAAEKADLDDANALRDPNSAISKSLRDGANLFGIKVDNTVSGKQLRDSGINLGSLLSAFENAQARRDAAALSARDRQEKLDDKKELRARLSDKQIQTISEYDKSLSTLKSILNEKDQHDTGPVAGRWHTMASWIGMNDADKAAFKADVGDSLAQYIKSISGAAVSEKERRDLIANLPTMNDNDEQFKAKAKMVQDRLEGFRDIELDLMQKQGKNVENFKSEKSGGGEDDARIDQFMKDNGIESREEAISILKEEGLI